MELRGAPGEQDVLGLGAAVPERLRDRVGELKQPLGLRRRTERPGWTRRRRTEALLDSRASGLGSHTQPGEHLRRQLLRLGEQPQDEVLGRM